MAGKPLVGIIMGSKTDLEILQGAVEVLREFGIEQEVKALVARSCGCETAPEALRQRVMLRLQSVRIEIDHREFRAD